MNTAYQIVELQEEIKSLREELRVSQEQNDKLADQLKKMRAIQKRWVRHATGCDVYQPGQSECDCGLYDALKET